MNPQTEIFYDHYKDTYANIKSKEKSRSTLFIISGLILFLLLLLCIEPTESISVITSIVRQQIGADIVNMFSIVISALWIALLYVVISYYQVCIYIERQYDYLHSIEALLSNTLGKEFAREGEAYKKNYPILSEAIYIFYNYLFPLIYIGCVNAAALCPAVDVVNCPYIDGIGVHM